MSPLRGIDDNAHQAPTNNARNRQRNNPTPINPRHHAPINRPDLPRAKPHAHRRAHDTLRRRDRQRQPRRHHNRDRGSELHAEAARGRVQCQPVPQIAHDVVAEDPKADDQGARAVAQDPDWDGGFGGQLAGVPD